MLWFVWTYPEKNIVTHKSNATSHTNILKEPEDSTKTNLKLKLTLIWFEDFINNQRNKQKKS